MPFPPKFIKAVCCYDHADIIWATSTSGSVEQTSFVQWALDAHDGSFYKASTDTVNTTEEDVYSVRVNHLSPDSRYLFRVVSVNRYGSVSSTTVSCQIKKRGRLSKWESFLSIEIYSSSGIIDKMTISRKRNFVANYSINAIWYWIHAVYFYEHFVFVY